MISLSAGEGGLQLSQSLILLHMLFDSSCVVCQKHPSKSTILIFQQIGAKAPIMGRERGFFEIYFSFSFFSMIITEPLNPTQFCAKNEFECCYPHSRNGLPLHLAVYVIFPTFGFCLPAPDGRYQIEELLHSGEMIFIPFKDMSDHGHTSLRLTAQCSLTEVMGHCHYKLDYGVM